MRKENQGDAYRDQQRAEQEGEADPEEEAHGALAFLRGLFRREDGRG